MTMLTITGTREHAVTNASGFKCGHACCRSLKQEFNPNIRRVDFLFMRLDDVCTAWPEHPTN